MKTGAVEFHGFRKRNGLVVPFHERKIADAVFKAADVVARRDDRHADRSTAERLAAQVTAHLNDPESEFYVHPDSDGRRIPVIEDVQDMVEIVLAENDLADVLSAYKRYRKQREVSRRKIQVRDGLGAHVDVTDASLLLVESSSNNVVLPWDRRRITHQLIRRANLSSEEATSIAKAVENTVITSRMHTISTALVRELVNNELAERGYREQLRDLSIYGISRDFVESLMYTKSTENSNVVNNNPEAVNLGIAELALKQWALDTIFSEEVKRAHDTAAIHLHDLGYPHRVYCSSHSIEYVKKYGLTNLVNLNTESKPARSASVLTGHLNTFLASMQANYAGALGIAYINVFYAPYLVGMADDAIKQIAQELIFNGSQNAFSRGGQTLFLDFNIHTGVPGYLRGVPAVGPGGHYLLRLASGETAELAEVLRDETNDKGYRAMDLWYTSSSGTRRLVLREHFNDEGAVIYDEEVAAELAERGDRVLTYGDFEPEARRFASKLLEVWGDGDRNGRVFEFPKCDFHVSEETFRDPDQYQIFQEACELASRNGSTYFIFDRDEVTLSACCRLRTTIEDQRMLQHPECMRFCGFQNVTINVPQAAYRASRQGDRSFAGLCAELDSVMELAVQAHLEKKTKIAELMSGPGTPLWQIGRIASDGVPYVDLDSCTYILGLIGVNDAVNFLLDEQLHDSEEAMNLGLRIVAHMYLKTRKLARKHGLKFTLEESPAESAARRLAKTDLVYFQQEAQDIVSGVEEDAAYYTNSIHLAADAPVSLVDRIREQAKFHSMIESGAIVHAFVGEEQPSAVAIGQLVQETLLRTQCAQLTISPEFTYCDDCLHTARGLQERCPSCGSVRVIGETRVVGYFSKVQNWNRSKRYGELVARQAGQYAIKTVDEAATETAEPLVTAATEGGA